MSVSTRTLSPEERDIALEFVTLLIQKIAEGVTRSEDFATEFYTLDMELQKDSEEDAKIIARRAAELVLDRVIDLGILDDPDNIPPETQRVLEESLNEAYQTMAEADDIEPEES